MSKRIYNDGKPSHDELAHYGVKGMRWGVRKDRRQAARAVKQQHKQYVKDETTRRKLNAKLYKEQDNEAWEKAFNKVYDKELALEKKRHQDIKESDVGSVKKFIQRAKVTADFSGLKRAIKEADAVVKTREQDRKKEHTEAMRKLEKKLDKKHKALMNEHVKGQPLSTAVHNYLQIDKLITQELTEGYVTLDANFGRQG